ncbi:MAG TPA: hypothetical protein ENN79_06400 [Desulfobacteraceae bacterium]|nr:hypothetical protein [Desulfobacteraceae bacterium]
MTHTLHRTGSEDSLSEDFVLLMMPSKDINHENSAPKLRRFFELALKNGCVRIGDCRLGNQYHQGGVDKLLENVEDRAVIHATFKDEASLTEMLRDLKSPELGLSVVVSGLFDNVNKCCREVGLKPHTINQSLGRWGNTDKLPDDKILEFNTMCGHGMVTVKLIERIVEKVKEGTMSPEEGAEELFKPCMCGVFSPHRAANMLRSLSKA